MDDNKKVSIFQTAKDIFQNFFKLLNDIRTLASLEAQLARESLNKILILGILIFVLALSAWGCIMGLAIAVILFYGFNLMSAFAFVLLFNLILISVLTLFIFRLKDNLSFNATRRQIKHTRTLLKGS